MGKIRVKTLGIDEQEKEQKKEAKKRQEKKSASRRTERVVAVEPSQEKLEQLSVVQPTGQPKTDRPKTENRKPKTDNRKKRARSKKYQTVAKLVDKSKTYPLEQAVELLSKLKLSRFDETVELHINATEKLSGRVALPHGTGKQVRVAIADDKLISEVEKGKVDFDVLLATPDMMPKLAKVARFLGPKGLMPNPKNATITQNPEEAVKKFQGGQVHFKTEAKNPILHLTVGKLSFGEKKLLENIKAVISVLPQDKIKNTTLKSTMSPGIKVS